MKSIITLKKKIVKFFEEKGFDFLTSVPSKRMQEMILTSGMKGNTGKTSDYAEHGSACRTTWAFSVEREMGRVESIVSAKKLKSVNGAIGVEKHRESGVHQGR